MFIGKYYHTLEAKGRLSLPKSFRAQHDEWIVTRGLDGGLFLFAKEAFLSEVEQLSSKPFTKKRYRDFVRLMTNEAQEVSADTNGRVQLPEYLIALAGLEKAVAVVGSMTRIEIWDRDRYHTYIESIENQAEQIAEELEADAE